MRRNKINKQILLKKDIIFDIFKQSSEQGKILTIKKIREFDK